MKHWVLVKDNEIIQHYHADNKPTIAATKGEVLELTEAYAGEVATAGEVNPAIHKLETTAGKYYGKWRILHTVSMKTATELLMDGWHYPEYSKRIKASVASTLNPQAAAFISELVLWWAANENLLKKWSDGEYLYFYCGEILSMHVDKVQANSSYITIENKP